jgi:SET domain
MCKAYNRYTASTVFQTLPPNEKLDSLLLSHLVAELFSNSKEGPLTLLIEDQPTPISTFSSLLSGPIANQLTPPISPMGPNDVLLEGVLDELYSRFGNNNFVIHSHLVSIAHGIFPLASRLFNHSCVPNAAAKYIFTESEPVHMEVVALRDIKKGEEVGIY